MSDNQKILIFLLFASLFSCQSNSTVTIDKFIGDWQLISLKRKDAVEDSVVQRAETTLHFKDSSVSLRTPHYFGRDTKYRKWSLKDSTLSIPYRHDIYFDTLDFRLIEIQSKKMILEKKSFDSLEMDTFYFERIEYIYEPLN